MTFFAASPSGVPALTARAQHVAGGDLRNAEGFLDERCLGAFTRAGRAEQDQSHES